MVGWRRSVEGGGGEGEYKGWEVWKPRKNLADAHREVGLLEIWKALSDLSDAKASHRRPFSRLQ